eukprot:TRINITY_DN6225_c0_g1_i3.p1 TRINITY_DN6225_c0_g1~~TRINITY_DN6225_c0_g1_i3.p1  ORF type:complete len:104 (+),score=12.82 TRINITY_DN6225_c0_g1_i3:324-635(+)
MKRQYPDMRIGIRRKYGVLGQHLFQGLPCIQYDDNWMVFPNLTCAYNFEDVAGALAGRRAKFFRLCPETMNMENDRGGLMADGEEVDTSVNTQWNLMGWAVDE